VCHCRVAGCGGHQRVKGSGVVKWVAPWFRPVNCIFSDCERPVKLVNAPRTIAAASGWLNPYHNDASPCFPDKKIAAKEHKDHMDKNLLRASQDRIQRRSREKAQEAQKKMTGGSAF
jgi:hypothetical protein